MNIPGYDQNPPMPEAQADGDRAGMNGDQQMQGDGLNHHEIHEMPDGSAHSTHTDPEGKVEEMDHDSYEDACAAAAGEGDGEGDEEAGDDAESSFADDGEDSGMNNIAKSYGSKVPK